MSDVQPHFSARTKARKRALDALFVADFNGDVDAAQVETGSHPLAGEIVAMFLANAAVVDERIASGLKNGWSLERMPRVDRCLARIAVTEMDHMSVAPGVAISEALELAQWLSTDTSPAFLNGLLGRLADSA